MNLNDNKVSTNRAHDKTVCVDVKSLCKKITIGSLLESMVIFANDIFC